MLFISGCYLATSLLICVPLFNLELKQFAVPSRKSYSKVGLGVQPGQGKSSKPSSKSSLFFMAINIDLIN